MIYNFNLVIVIYIYISIYKRILQHLIMKFQSRNYFANDIVCSFNKALIKIRTILIKGSKRKFYSYKILVYMYYNINIGSFGQFAIGGI